jgi:release factor glutamine methyltransferase
MENKPDSVSNFINKFREELNAAYDRNEIDQFLYILFEEWKGWSRSLVHLKKEEILSVEEGERFRMALADLKRHKPIQYITGTTHFHDLELTVTPDVLIPRQETEELVDLIIKDNANRKNDEFSILDIGTGSGCIALSLQKEFQHSTVHALDNSLNALHIAKINAERNGCKILCYQYDILLKTEQSFFSSYEIIASNPPYIMESEKGEMKENVLEYEPHEALFVPDKDPLVYYKAIAEFASLHLSCPGTLYLEINENFGPEIKTLLLTKEFNSIDIIKDFNEKDRFIRAVLNNRVAP